MPSTKEIERVLELISTSVANHAHFFNRVDSTDWLEPLVEAGFFKKPLAAVREGGMITFPVWPEAHYLARIATKVPERVLEVMKKIEATDNERVQMDLIDVALQLPPNESAAWASEVSKWVSSRRRLYLLLPQKITEFVEHLARVGKTGAAHRLAESFLALRPVDDPDEGEKLENRLRCDAYTYNQAIDRITTALLPAVGFDAIRLACGLLEDTLVGKSRGVGDSLYWRPAIEDHEQNFQHGDPRNALVTAIRDGLDQLLGESPDLIGDAVEELERREPLIFRRLALHVLSRSPSAAPGLVEARLLDAALYGNHRVFREYWILAREGMGVMSEEGQGALLSMIDGGSGLYSVEKPDEEADCEKRHWKRRIYSIIRTTLPADRLEELDGMVEEFGELEHPDFEVYSTGVWVGPTSPKTEEELGEMEPQAVVDYLRKWAPEEDWRAPTPEGLGRNLSKVIAKKPEEYSRVAQKFIGCDITYMRAVIQGFTDSVKARTDLNWPGVIGLCEHVAYLPREEPQDQPDGMNRDPHTGWARKSVMDLLSSAMETDSLPIGLKGNVWKIIEHVAHDPDPSVEEGEGGMDPATLSINTTRGAALHAVVKYGLWVRRDYGQRRGEEGGKQEKTEIVPEVWGLLDRHLDPENEASIGVRAVYGQWFPWLTMMNEAWALENRPKIFGEAPGHEKFGPGAWKAYVALCPVYDRPFEILEAEYRRAVDDLGSDSTDRVWSSVPRERLTEHLMVMYCRGAIELDAEDGLMASFFAVAPVELRSYAMAFIGRILGNEASVFDEQALGRLKALWRFRHKFAEGATRENSNELTPTGWWFISKRFDDDWSLDTLEAAANLAGSVEPEHKVLERLGELAVVHPERAVYILELIVRGSSESWRALLWRDEISKILEQGLLSHAKAKTRDLIQYIEAMGCSDYRDLVS